MQNLMVEWVFTKYITLSIVGKDNRKIWETTLIYCNWRKFVELIYRYLNRKKFMNILQKCIFQDLIHLVSLLNNFFLGI